MNKRTAVPSGRLHHDPEMRRQVRRAVLHHRAVQKTTLPGRRALRESQASAAVIEIGNLMLLKAPVLVATLQTRPSWNEWFLATDTLVASHALDTPLVDTLINARCSAQPPLDQGQIEDLLTDASLEFRHVVQATKAPPVISETGQRAPRRVSRRMKKRIRREAFAAFKATVAGASLATDFSLNRDVDALQVVASGALDSHHG